MNPPLENPAIAIYTGSGTSHSWLWFVDIFERAGMTDLSFADEEDLRAGRLKASSVLAVSGWDTFTLAEGLGREGAEVLEAWVRGGGLYLGSCAGAYLPLRSSQKPLHHFNFVEAKISNLTAILPPAQKFKEKFSQPYGCSFIYHPVREAVRISGYGHPPFPGTEDFPAPLYGGPAMIPRGDVETLAWYSGFTEKTAFLIDPELARETLIGKSAVIRKRLGSGVFYLFGPHLEHPHYRKANQLVLETIRFEQKPGPEALDSAPAGETVLNRPQAGEWIRALKRELSNARIVVTGLENEPVSWQIGRKTYEPLKMRVFLEALWKRLPGMGKTGRLIIPERCRDLPEDARDLTEKVRGLKIRFDRKQETAPLAEEIFSLLKKLAPNFLTVYFKSNKAAVHALH
ncbi:MAG: hypothetical protein MUF69_10475 [Desulfobacterota bacterium]|nr:hypothetical protein [Thermodesulfobacteriota bacterium]